MVLWGHFRPKASFIQVGRTSLTKKKFSFQSGADFLGDNLLMGIGATADTVFTNGTGLVLGCYFRRLFYCKRRLDRSFRLGTDNNENIFNVSVNGINGLIEIPSQFYAAPHRRGP